MRGGVTTGRRSVREVELWRQRILDRGSATVAALSFLWVLVFPFREEYRSVRHLVVLAGVVLIAPSLRILNYRSRGYLMIGGLCALVPFLAWLAGPAVGTLMAGLLAIIVAGLLFDVAHAVVIWILTSMLLCMGFFATRAPSSPFRLHFLDPTLASNALRLTATYVVFSSVVAVGVSIVVNRLGKSLKEAKEAQIAAERAQEERKQALSQMVEAQKFEVMAQLSGSVAHDVNNSLQVLLAYSELLQIGGQADSAIRSMGEEMHDLCVDTSKMARQLLTLGKRVVLDKQTIDLGQEVERMARALEKIIPADVRLIIDAEEGHCASVDTVQLNQALLNLSINAVHAMPEGGELKLKLCLVEDSMLELSVVDTGSGMEQSLLKDIFRPFFSTKGEGGSGLGLSAVKAIVEQHGGQLNVESTVGVGTCFRMRLPSCNPSEEGGGSDSKVASLQGTTLLLAEDDPRVRAAVAEMLRRAGAQVDSAESTDSALELLLENESYDALCTDVVMPGRPTKELLDAFAEKNPRSPIIVCSAYVESELVRRGIQSREYFHIAKPFTSDALVTKVRRAINKLQKQKLVRRDA